MTSRSEVHDQVTLTNAQIDGLVDIREEFNATALRVRPVDPRLPSLNGKAGEQIVTAFSHEAGWSDEIHLRESGRWMLKDTGHWRNPEDRIVR